MRGSYEGLTLRKGIVIKKLYKVNYLAKDILNNNEVLVSLSGKLAMSGLTLEVGQVIYFVVSLHNIKKGRLAIEGYRNWLEDFPREKEMLDNEEDPLG